jgi:hypothetical protein
MNERIRELAEQAGFPEWSQKTIGFELEKFAMLIIEKCGEIADDNFNKGFCPVGDYIKQHFGVE